MLVEFFFLIIPHPSSLIPYLFDDERAVLGAEADAVAEGDADALLARAVGGVVEVAVGVGLVEVDGGGNLIGLHRAESGGEPGRARRALRVADLRLRARHRNAR